MEYNLSYHEVVPDQTLPEYWKEISLNTGGTQSTLQDIKVTERANGYSYKDATKFYTRNRFIYWRISNDILELVEHSLDLNLTANNIKYKFVDTPILDGVSVHETQAHVIVLVPTVCSIHRLTFSHPSQLHQQDELIGTHLNLSVASIFSDANAIQARNPSTFYVFNHPTAHSQLPHLTASTLIDNKALFLFAYPTNDMILLKHFESGECESVELKMESIMPRFLSEIAVKFRAKPSDNNIVNMVLYYIQNEVYAIVLMHDGYLRVWNCTTVEYLGSSSILMESNNKNLLQGGQSFMLRKATDGDDDILLGLYVGTNTDSKFFILDLMFNENDEPIFTINSYLIPPFNDLVDFCFTPSQIWTLSRGKEGECQVYYAKISTNIETGVSWMPAILDQISNQHEVPYNCEYVDPREANLNYIFYPGRFPLSVINKALKIYKGSTIHCDLNLSSATLKQRVCQEVENEIKMKLQENEVNDEDFLECATQRWREFYSCCFQYQVSSLKPLGILFLPTAAGIVLLKRKMYSLLRPLDLLEHLTLCTDYITKEHFLELEDLFTSRSEAEDVVSLLTILNRMDDQLNDLFRIIFEEEMEHLKSPEEIITQLLSEIEVEEIFIVSMQHNLKDISNLERSLENVLKVLTMEFFENVDNDVQCEKSESNINQLFSSQLGISFVTETFRQQSYYRFSLCRKLLTFLHIFLLQHTNDTMYNFIDTVYMDKITNLMKSYFITYWFSKQLALPVLPLDTIMQRLSPLKFSPVFNLGLNNMQTIPLMSLFIGSSGGFVAHKLLSHEKFVSSEWHTSLLQYIIHLRKLIWPEIGNLMFVEWLLVSGQHLCLQQYVHLLKDWCEINIHSRNFLLATTFLTTGAYHKAYDLFINTFAGVQEEYIYGKIQQPSTENSSLIIIYFLKVIQLFEVHGARDYALQLADRALAARTNGDPLIATLYSIKFKHHLALGHYELAYKALDENPEEERKRDNLRDLVKTLLDNRELKTLMNLEYTKMESLLCNILCTRARACDTVDNMFYDTLYCYYIKRGMKYMRYAGAIMYEQAFRLRHHNTIEALEKQLKCYMAAVNALTLCPESCAWVLIPTDPDLPEEIITLPALAGSGKEPEVLKLKEKVEVIDLKMIRLELSLVSARFKLARFDPTLLTNSFSTPAEVITYLNGAGLFHTALKVSIDFEMPYDMVFEALTRQCVLLSEYEDLAAWNWLGENNLHELPSIGGGTPSSVAWLMLKMYIDEHEDEHMTIIHKIVCQKIIRMEAYVPQWLLDSYKKRNAAELLRLYFYYGRLTDAYELAMDYLLAALGHGSDHFGIESGGIGLRTESLCLPVNVIDSLIYELQLQNESESPAKYLNEYKELKELFLKYIETSARMSNQRCNVGM